MTPRMESKSRAEAVSGLRPFAIMVSMHNATREIDHFVAQMSAFRKGAGPHVGLHLDLNFNFKTEGYIRLAQALEPFDLVWLEIDSYDPSALATIRRSAAPTPAARSASRSMTARCPAPP